MHWYLDTFEGLLIVVILRFMFAFYMLFYLLLLTAYVPYFRFAFGGFIVVLFGGLVVFSAC